MHKYILCSIFLLLLAFASCTTGKKNDQTKTGFIGGQNGITTTLDIASGKLNEVLDNDLEDFQINLNVENKGEYPIKENDILATITGVDYRSFSLTNPSLKNVEALDKIRQEQGKILPGGQTVLSFPANFADDLPVDQSYDLGVNVCYKYQTGATANMCLRKEATKRGEATDKCKIDETKAVGSSAAPLQVTSLSQRPTGKNEISFTLTIENVGKGDVYLPTFVQNTQCLEKQDMKNKFDVAVSFPSNRPAITCSALKGLNHGTLQLIQGKITMTCKMDTSQEQETTFTRSPSIQLDYTYKDIVSKKITVKNAA